MGNFPTLADYRDPLLDHLGGVLQGTTTLDPDIQQPDDARALNSAKLYDSEKLADAYKGQYAWIPRYSNAGRVEERGYRTRFIAVFRPPSASTYTLRFFGYGEVGPLPASSSAASIATAIHMLNAEDLGATEVTRQSDGTFQVLLPSRIGMAIVGGTMVSQNGVGVLLMNRDWSTPLPAGTSWLLCPDITFESDDNVTGIHACINMALNDQIVPDLFPYTATLPSNQRPHTISLRDVAPWLTSDMITGFYAPTDWQMTAVFVPPASGTYTALIRAWKDFGPNLTPLAYNATGEQLQTALREIGGLGETVSVVPLGAAPSYTVTWRSQYHAGQFVPSAGYISQLRNDMLIEPFATAIYPVMMNDYESPVLTDPGYAEGATWFIGCNRPGGSRICPQTYPYKTDGSGELDTSALPILGTQWVESMSGLRNDLDQAYPAIDKVWPLGLRYVYEALANSAPQGEASIWEAKGRTMASTAAAKTIYRRQQRRGAGGSMRGGALVGSKGLGFWLP